MRNETLILNPIFKNYVYWGFHQILDPSGVWPKVSETANRAETGKLQFWSQPSEIFNLKSSNTNETLATAL